MLAALIDSLPANVHLALVTRADPRLYLIRLRVNQQMTQTHMDDLRFRQEEVRAFFESAIGATLSYATLYELQEMRRSILEQAQHSDGNLAEE